MFAFALKTGVLVSNVFASLQKEFLFYLMCSLRFENNLLSSEGVRFASISKKTLLSKLSFAFVSLALPLLNIILEDKSCKGIDYRYIGYYFHEIYILKRNK